MEKLTKEEIKIALNAINRLCIFECEQRHIRGYGVFSKKDLPVPELVKLIEWLKEESKDPS